MILCSDEFLQEGPEDACLVKLALFSDEWIHRFHYEGNLHLVAVYRCFTKVIEWGIQWKSDEDGRV